MPTSTDIPSHALAKRTAGRAGGAGAHRVYSMLVLLCVCGSCVDQAIAAGAPGIVIALKSRVQTTHDPVLLGHVADVVTSDPRLTRQLSEIDLADLGPNDSTSIKQRQVAVRLQLAGFATDSFRIVGADQVLIRNASPGRVVWEDDAPTTANGRTPRHTSTRQPPPGSAPEQQIIRQLREQLAKQWRVAPGEIDVRLLQTLPTMKPAPAGQIPRFEITIAADQRPGKIHPRVYRYAGDQLLDVWTLPVDALRQYETVAVVRRVARGQVLTREDLETRQQFLRQRGQLLGLEEAVGRMARRSLEPGDSLHNYDLQSKSNGSPASATTASSSPVIRRRDTIRIVVRTGTLTVVIADGQALEDAAMGESIRVRNPRSKLIVVGRVVSKNQVEVAL